MSVIKSFSVGNGDMFYIDHNSDNLTIIDCCITADNKNAILGELAQRNSEKGITRFISTHPDEDHFRGLEMLDDTIDLHNFYCVRNQAVKDDETVSFIRYRDLRDHPSKAFYISKDCRRKWMNVDDDERQNSGINVLWPDPEDVPFKIALAEAAAGWSPNNISAILKYQVEGGATALWMGDLETDFMRLIESKLDLPRVDILFAPHHGRDSGRIPVSMLNTMTPRVIVIGEAPSEHLCYYSGYNTICQNTAGDILFDCVDGAVHVYTSNVYTARFLKVSATAPFRPGYFYAGSISLTARASAQTA